MSFYDHLWDGCGINSDVGSTSCTCGFLGGKNLLPNSGSYDGVLRRIVAISLVSATRSFGWNNDMLQRGGSGLVTCETLVITTVGIYSIDLGKWLQYYLGTVLL